MYELGHKVSETHKQKLKLIHLGNKYALGYKHTKEARQKMSVAKHNMTEETKQKLRIKRYEQKTEPALGYKHTKETKQKMRLAKLGKKHSKEHNQKIKLANTGKKHAEKTKQKLRVIRSKRIFPFKDTKPERMMQLALTLEGIKFKKHKLIRIDKFYHQVDIFIEPNICIEVDGDYWHNLPDTIRRDLEVNAILTENGFYMLRIREKTIMNDIGKVAKNIKELLKNLGVMSYIY